MNTPVREDEGPTVNGVLAEFSVRGQGFESQRGYSEE